jgi:hypothetical protein
VQDDAPLLDDALVDTGSVHHVAGKLTASRIDIIATRFPDGRDDAGVSQHLRKRLHLSVR